LVSDLRRRGVGFRSLHEAINTTTPGGRLVFHIFAALAEFILYRVALSLDVTVEPGYRDENHDEAAQVAQSGIRETGFLAIRYLNVHEAMGSLSLAVCRVAIEGVQALRIPPPALGTPVQEDLVVSVEATRLRLQQMSSEQAPPTPIDRLRAQVPGAQRYNPEQYELENDISERIAEALLPGVSPAVRKDVTDAMGAWEDSQGDLTDRTGAGEPLGGRRGAALPAKRSHQSPIEAAPTPRRLNGGSPGTAGGAQNRFCREAVSSRTLGAAADRPGQKQPAVVEVLPDRPVAGAGAGAGAGPLVDPGCR
jgi:hypothetical protein